MIRAYWAEALRLAIAALAMGVLWWGATALLRDYGGLLH
jgi:hypothetical protein